jgi:hypothetical protein
MTGGKSATNDGGMAVTLQHAGDCSIYKAHAEFPDAVCCICDCGALRNAAGVLDTPEYYEAWFKHLAAIDETLKQRKCDFCGKLELFHKMVLEEGDQWGCEECWRKWQEYQTPF